MKSDHLIFSPERLNAQCECCSEFTDRPHVIGDLLLCAACCTVCSPQAPAERTGPVVTTAGVQEGLFL